MWKENFSMVEINNWNYYFTGVYTEKNIIKSKCWETNSLDFQFQINFEKNNCWLKIDCKWTSDSDSILKNFRIRIEYKRIFDSHFHIKSIFSSVSIFSIFSIPIRFWENFRFKLDLEYIFDSNSIVNAF